jgi:hypothetical protein
MESDVVGKKGKFKKKGEKEGNGKLLKRGMKFT